MWPTRSKGRSDKLARAECDEWLGYVGVTRRACSPEQVDGSSRIIFDQPGVSVTFSQTENRLKEFSDLFLTVSFINEQDRIVCAFWILKRADAVIGRARKPSLEVRSTS